MVVGEFRIVFLGNRTVTTEFRICNHCVWTDHEALPGMSGFCCRRVGRFEVTLGDGLMEFIDVHAGRLNGVCLTLIRPRLTGSSGQELPFDTFFRRDEGLGHQDHLFLPIKLGRLGECDSAVFQRLRRRAVNAGCNGVQRLPANDQTDHKTVNE